MRKLIVPAFLLLSLSSLASNFYTDAYVYSLPNQTTIVTLTTDTTISGNWNLAGKTLYLLAKVGGTGTVQNAIIVGLSSYMQLFDTTVALTGCKTREFSAMWYGASPSVGDNFNALQKSITNCIASNIKNLFIPIGNYSFSQRLKVFTLSGSVYIGTDINIYGDAGVWADGTTLTYTATSGWALGYQMAKGGSLHNLKIVGQFITPAKVLPGYYSITQANYNDASGLCAPFYSGIVIDYDATKNVGGSTALHVYDVWVTNFDILYSISPNLFTQNADFLIFERIRCGFGRLGIQGGQAQEKHNVVRDLISWDNIHTLISLGNWGLQQAGNYNFDGANIAGGCVRIFNVNEKGWFPSSFEHFYAEGFGTVGTITCGDSQNKLPTTVFDCHFYPAYQSQAGSLVLINSNSTFVLFKQVTLAYYGRPQDTLHLASLATYDNPDFGGSKVANTVTGSAVIFYPFTAPISPIPSIKVTQSP